MLKLQDHLQRIAGALVAAQGAVAQLVFGPTQCATQYIQLAAGHARRRSAARSGTGRAPNVVQKRKGETFTQFATRMERALNNGEPFPGERVLHRLLGGTYFAHILPPLDETEASFRKRVEEDLAGAVGRGGEALQRLGTWLAEFRDGMRGGRH